jgi:hypothetical protein
MKLALLAFVLFTLPCATLAQGSKPLYPEVTEARARLDVKSGNLKQYIYGLPGPNDFTIRKILIKKYKIDTILTGCEVTEDFRNRVSIYNKISDLEIKKKFKKSYQELFREEEKRIPSKKHGH